MKYFIEGKEDVVNLVSSHLKSMGIKIPKIKKPKISIPKQQGKGPFQSKLKVFGVHLDAQDVASNYSHLPKFILSCTDYLQKHSKEVGLFRKAGSIARQKNLRVKIENGGSFDGSEPNDVAALMKQWLRELPEPLIPSYLHESFIRCQNLNDVESRITSTLLVCLFLPPNHLYTLKHLMSFLAEIATDVKQNRMDVENLALIMAPNIFVIGTNVTDKSCIKVQKFRSVIELLIENADKIGELPCLLSSKLATLEKSELSSPNDIESSPGMSRKNYLLRSIKKFVKPNSTPPLQTVLSDNRNILSPRHPTPENKCKEIKATATGTKEKGSLFATRSSEDICKRSFGLLRKKEKKRLKVSSDCSSLTQSLGTESLINFPIQMDKANVDSIIQEPLFEKELNMGCIFEFDQFDEKVAKLEDIEMTTFKTHVINQDINLQAFPIPSFSSNLFEAKPKFLFQQLETQKACQIQEIHSILLNKDNSTNLHVDMLVEVTSSTCNLDKVSKDNKDSYCSKTPKRVQISCSPKTLQLFTCEYKNRMETDIFPITNICSSKTDVISSDLREFSTVMNERRNNTTDLLHVDSKYLQSIDTELSSKRSSLENVGIFQMIREETFIIEPKKTGSSIDEAKNLDQRQMSNTVLNNDCFGSITSDIRNNAVHKKQCKASISKSKRTIQNGKVIKKSNNSVKANCTKSKPLSKKSALKNVRTNSIQSNSNKEETKLIGDQTSLYRDFEKDNFPLSASKENQFHNGSISPSMWQSDQFSSSFESGRKPKRKSTSMAPTTPSSFSESKIPRLRNSAENYRANSSEAATSHIKKVPKATNTKEANSCGFPTRIPVKYDNAKSNISTLQLSNNDSCFLTPNRNAQLSPNSIVWMSGNKYFVSCSPEEELINKRESIAMILESNAGHVQAKVHLYDDLIRESEYFTDSVPCHSTPTSKFSKRLSSSSQSLKIPSKHRTKLQSSNSISYSKRTSANKSDTVQSGDKSQKLAALSPKFNTHLSMPTPIKGHSLKDVTNKGFLLNAPKNCKNVPVKNDTVSVFPDKNSIEIRKKLKRNSFSGNTSQKLPKKVSRSESTPGPRPHRRVSCLIQESYYAK